MGHYDDCYEATRLADEQKRRENLLRWIKESIDDMENHQLELVYEITQLPDDYYTFFRMIKRIVKQDRI